MIEQHKETSSGNETKKDMTEEQQPQPIPMDVDVDIVHNQGGGGGGEYSCSATYEI